MERPQRVLSARAPLRANDIGGWTDTWFAGRGRVLNLAVAPPVEVRVEVFGKPGAAPERVRIRALNFGETFSFVPEEPGPASGPHALLRHAVGVFAISKDLRLEISLSSPVPPGFATGTSASVCVALLGALDRLTGGGRTPDELAALAHRVETEKLGRQSGIQDQISAARGGVSFIRVTHYPASEVETLSLEPRTREALDRRLRLVGLGGSHDSSALHERVIAELGKGGPRRVRLDEMSRLAEEARASLLGGDLESYGRLMTENNECQRGLAAEIVAPEADAVIRIARKHGASGWKVNGAGGRGGSLTLLAAADDDAARAMDREIDALGGGIRTLPISLSAIGLTVREEGSG
ncbi:MAG TPA: GHMP kinase [Acidobacteriota bacterium]|nr:GHMP kinase [Acidobacteriota bacterium]